MAITLLGCNCPCTNSENPCDCCPCVTGLKIYSNISLSVQGYGNSCNEVLSGVCQRTVDYIFTYTNSINSLIDIPNGGYSGITCPSCQGVGFSGNASEGDGFLSTTLDYEQTWDLAAGTNCAPGATGCSGSSYPPLEYGGCPKDVCLEGQVLHISSNTGGGETNIQESNCNYNLDGDVDDHITVYACSDDRGPYGNDPNLLSAGFEICPTTSLFSLGLEFGDGGGSAFFSLSTNRSNGITFGYAVLNNNVATAPLYINYLGPAGVQFKGISGTAVIGIEFDYNAVTRDPETGECPLI